MNQPSPHTDKIVAELMALADAYATECCAFHNEAEADVAKAALEQAIRRAVDWGPPSLYVRTRDLEESQMVGMVAMRQPNSADRLTPLYARSQA